MFINNLIHYNIIFCEISGLGEKFTNAVYIMKVYKGNYLVGALNSLFLIYFYRHRGTEAQRHRGTEFFN